MQGKTAWTTESLSFAGFCFHSFGCGEFPVSVWLGARGTRMQFTSFPGRSAASGTRHEQYLFRGEFFRLHQHIMQLSYPRECSILTISEYVRQGKPVEIGSRTISFSFNSDQK
jgi:hypothetical protein